MRNAALLESSKPVIHATARLGHAPTLLLRCFYIPVNSNLRFSLMKVTGLDNNMEASIFFELVTADVRRTSAFDEFESVSLHTNKKDQLLAGLFCWCGQQDSNLHAHAVEPKSTESTNSTMPAYGLFYHGGLWLSIGLFLWRSGEVTPIGVTSACRKTISLRASAHTGVAIRIPCKAEPCVCLRHADDPLGSCRSTSDKENGSPHQPAGWFAMTSVFWAFSTV